MRNKNSFVYFLHEGTMQSDKKYLKLMCYAFIGFFISMLLKLVGWNNLAILGVILIYLAVLSVGYIKAIIELNKFLNHKRYTKDDWYLSGLSEMPFIVLYLKLRYRKEYLYFKSVKLSPTLDYSRINFNKTLRPKDIQTLNKIANRHIISVHNSYSLLDSINEDIKYQDKLNDFAKYLKHT